MQLVTATEAILGENLSWTPLPRTLQLLQRRPMKNTVMRIRIQDPGSGAFLIPGSGIRIWDPNLGWKKIRIRDEHPRSFFPRAYKQF